MYVRLCVCKSSCIGGPVPKCYESQGNIKVAKLRNCKYKPILVYASACICVHVSDSCRVTDTHPIQFPMLNLIKRMYMSFLFPL